MTAQEEWQLLNARRLPGRLSVEQTAVLLGFKEHDVTHLIAAGHLVPLGRPAANAPKKFASGVIEEYRADKKWLHAATLLLTRVWAQKNRRANNATKQGNTIAGRFARSAAA